MEKSGWIIVLCNDNIYDEKHQKEELERSLVIDVIVSFSEYLLLKWKFSFCRYFDICIEENLKNFENISIEM